MIKTATSTATRKPANPADRKPHLKALRSDPRYLKGINFGGNKKLRNTDKTRFFIWNLPARSTCPYRCTMCSAACYALKAERAYPSARRRRAENFAASLAPDFAERMIYTIGVELDSPKVRRVVANGGHVVFRIHESGDFYNLDYTRKWVQIAAAFAQDPRIIFMAYTKSLPYFAEIERAEGVPANLVVRSSLWADTSAEMIEMTAVLRLPVYTALTAAEMDEREQNGESFTRCRCDDCGTCGKCWNKSERLIICEIH